VHSKELAALATESMENLKAVDIRVLDVGRMTSITDYMVFASGTSDRHVRSVAANVIDEARQAGHRAIGVEGQESGEWVLVDLGDVVVHVMQAATREFYKLENLWEVQEPSGATRA
jgi:ribosome-associated protein